MRWNLGGQDALFLLMMSSSFLRFPSWRQCMLLAKQLKVYLGVSCWVLWNILIQFVNLVEVLMFYLKDHNENYVIFWSQQRKNVTTITLFFEVAMCFSLRRQASKPCELWSVYFFQGAQFERISWKIYKIGKRNVYFESSLISHDFITKVYLNNWHSFLFQWLMYVSFNKKWI